MESSEGTRGQAPDPGRSRRMLCPRNLLPRGQASLGCSPAQSSSRPYAYLRADVSHLDPSKSHGRQFSFTTTNRYIQKFSGTYSRVSVSRKETKHL